jgi:hypothetical protein
LHDHLLKWASRTGRNPDKVKDAVRKSFELRVILDLSNVDKHGYPARDGGHSGRAPNLTEVNRVMQLSTGTQPNSSATVLFTPMPEARLVGSGSAKVVVTGTIVDRSGAVLGDLRRFLETAVGAWEGLLRELGV